MGRKGDLVANTPFLTFPPNLGGFTVADQCSFLDSENFHNSQIWVNSSIPFTISGFRYSDSNTIWPVSPFTRPLCRGLPNLIRKIRMNMSYDLHAVCSFNFLNQTTASMVKKHAHPPTTLEMGSAIKTPFSPSAGISGRRMVSGTTMTTFRKIEKGDGISGLSQCLEGTLSYKLQCHKTKSKEIKMHGRNRCSHQIRLRVKHADKYFRKCQGQDPDNTGINNADHRHKTVPRFTLAFNPAP